MSSWTGMILCKLAFHNWDNWKAVIIDERKYHTVMHPNECFETHKCTRCNQVETRTFDHAWSNWSIVKDKCEEVRECTRCTQRETRAISHTWNNWSLVKDKCEEVRECTLCTQRETRAISHTWSSWSLVKDKCEESRECTLCTQRETRVISHTWSSWSLVKDKCKEGRECTRCAQKKTRTISHAWGDWSLVKDRCEESRDCMRCVQRETRVISHVWGKWNNQGIHKCVHCASTESRKEVTCVACGTMQPNKHHLIAIESYDERSVIQPSPKDVSEARLYCLTCAENAEKRKLPYTSLNKYDGVDGYQAVWHFVTYPD